MAKRRSKTMDLRAFEGPNVVRLDDYRPKPLSKAMNARMRIAESFVATQGHAKAVGAITLSKVRELSPEEELMAHGLWAAVPQVLRYEDQEMLLTQAVEDPGMPEAWHQEAIKKLLELTSGEINGQT